MVIALLLAQLVLPGPPSAPIQPPGMICASGDCSGGPVVYRTSQRGRLVVACDMTSDTCSDGRKITTKRATPVPCEVEPGVWQTIPEDTGCYSVRGLESWAQTTTYLSHGAALGESPWVASSPGASLEPLPDGWRIHKSEGGLYGWRQDVSGMADDTYTSTCIVRGSAPGTRLYVSSGNFCTVDIDSEDWTKVSCTREASAAHFAGVYPCGNADPECSLDVKACWYERSPTPGRPCWGGEAPVTCAADRHTISTEGWPTESGEISLVFTVGESTKHQYLIDGRATGDVSAKALLLLQRPQRQLRLDIVPGEANRGPVLEAGRPYAARLRMAGGRTAVFLDGVKVIDVPGTPNWATVATLGTRFEQDEALNGPISSLRIRSAE